VCARPKGVRVELYRYVCVCVCVRESEREGGRGRGESPVFGAVRYLKQRTVESSERVSVACEFSAFLVSDVTNTRPLPYSVVIFRSRDR
jgi:hypothetical protein